MRGAWATLLIAVLLAGCSRTITTIEHGDSPVTYRSMEECRALNPDSPERCVTLDQTPRVSERRNPTKDQLCNWVPGSPLEVLLIGVACLVWPGPW